MLPSALSRSGVAPSGWSRWETLRMSRRAVSSTWSAISVSCADCSALLVEAARAAFSKDSSCGMMRTCSVRVTTARCRASSSSECSSAACLFDTRAAEAASESRRWSRHEKLIAMMAPTQTHVVVAMIMMGIGWKKSGRSGRSTNWYPITPTAPPIPPSTANVASVIRPPPIVGGSRRAHGRTASSASPCTSHAEMLMMIAARTHWDS